MSKFRKPWPTRFTFFTSRFTASVGPLVRAVACQARTWGCQRRAGPVRSSAHHLAIALNRTNRSSRSGDIPIPQPMVAPSGSDDEGAPSRPADRCDASVLIKGHREFTCEKDAAHEGMHEAEMTGRWKRVIWPA